MTLKPLQTIFDNAFKKRLLRASGRNFLGRICVFHQGAGRVSLYRPVDLFRRLNLFGRVIRIRRVLSRTAFVATILYANGLVSCIISSEGLSLGSLVYSGSNVPVAVAGQKRAFAIGSALPLSAMSLFSLVHNTEFVPFQGARLFRAAGTAATLVAKDSSKATLKSFSGWLIKVPLNSMATIGRCSNAAHKHERIPKAGANRWRGIRPTVRGVVKNPCDHPHGGGEGRGSPPAAQLTPWSKLTKGTPTTKKKWAVARRRLYKTIRK
jgi:large subunit ribosomal protein L2